MSADWKIESKMQSELNQEKILLPYLFYIIQNTHCSLFIKTTLLLLKILKKIEIIELNKCRLDYSLHFPNIT